jgi:hypothetical protein
MASHVGWWTQHERDPMEHDRFERGFLVGVSQELFSSLTRFRFQVDNDQNMLTLTFCARSSTTPSTSSHPAGIILPVPSRRSRPPEGNGKSGGGWSISLSAETRGGHGSLTMASIRVSRLRRRLGVGLETGRRLAREILSDDFVYCFNMMYLLSYSLDFIVLV